MYALSMLTARRRARRRRRTGRRPSRASPGSCRPRPRARATAGTPSTSPSVCGGCDGSCTTSPVAPVSWASAIVARVPSTEGGCRRSRSAAGRSHRIPAPSGRRSRCRSGRRRTPPVDDRSTLPAVTHEMPCSLERPPNTTATRGLRLSPGVGSFIPADPTGLVSGDARGLSDPRPVDCSLVRAGPPVRPAVERARPDLAAVDGRRGRRPPEHRPDAPLNMPIVMASTYVAGGDLEYSRYGNPTLDRVRGRAPAPSRAVAA